jgi:hypothetical protein
MEVEAGKVGVLLASMSWDFPTLALTARPRRTFTSRNLRGYTTLPPTGQMSSGS